jgi:hypothetical protein
MYRRPRKSPPTPESHQPLDALAAMKRSEFLEQPLGGFAGEMAIPRVDEPPPLQGAQPIQFPPPPWSENYDPALDPDHEPAAEQKRGRHRSLRKAKGMFA